MKINLFKYFKIFFPIFFLIIVALLWVFIPKEKERELPQPLAVSSLPDPGQEKISNLDIEEWKGGFDNVALAEKEYGQCKFLCAKELENYYLKINEWRQSTRDNLIDKKEDSACRNFFVELDQLLLSYQLQMLVHIYSDNTEVKIESINEIERKADEVTSYLIDEPREICPL